MDQINVLVVDDQRLIREGIASLLDIQEGIKVTGTAGNGVEALEQIAQSMPDIALVDVRMPVMDGIAATAEIKRRYPDCRVLMLTTFDDEEYIIKSLQAGAIGYLLKDIPPADLAQAVKLAYAGVYQLNSAVAGKLISAAQSEGQAAPVCRKAKPLPPDTDLTKRELEVLKLVATGATNREIAEQLYVSEGTIKNHVSSILSRLGLRDRVQAALFAHEHGLV